MKNFKRIEFSIEIATNLKSVFLDSTINLQTNSYYPYKKPNERLLYINTVSNHPPKLLLNFRNP